MGTGEFGMLIFSTILIIIFSCAGIYGFKEGRKEIKEDKLLLELYDLLKCLLSSV